MPCDTATVDPIGGSDEPVQDSGLNKTALGLGVAAGSAALYVLTKGE